MSWKLVYQSELKAFPIPDREGYFYPIQTQSIILFNSQPLIIKAQSLSAKPYWFKAGYLTQVESLDGFYPTVFRQVVPFGETLISLPDYGRCELRFAPVPWLSQLFLDIYQKEKVFIIP